MSSYLLLESRDPFEDAGVTHNLALAQDLVQNGHEVTLFLVQNGVLPARPCTHSRPLSQLAAAGVRVLADEFSLRERGIAQDRLCEGVKPAPLDVVLDHLAAGGKTLWH